MIKTFSKSISYIFHPIFLPLLSVFILFQLPFYINYKYTLEYRNAIYLILLLNTIILPVLACLYLLNRKVISSMGMPTAKERRIPYFVALVIFIFTLYLLEKINFPFIYLSFFRSVAMSLILLFFLAVANYKVSAHLCGFGGICGMLAVLSISFNVETFEILCLFLLLAGLVGSSRLYLKAHSIDELFLGFLIGFFAQMYLLF